MVIFQGKCNQEMREQCIFCFYFLFGNNFQFTQKEYKEHLCILSSDLPVMFNLFALSFPTDMYI